MSNRFRKTWVGPSGQEYVYRALNPFEQCLVYSGLPMLADPAKTNGAAPGDPTPHELERAQLIWMKTIVQGTVSPRIVEKESGDVGAIVFAEMGPDMEGLYNRIKEATMPAQEAAEAGTFRGERGELPPDPLDGEGVRADAVGADAGKPDGPVVQPDGLVEGARASVEAGV